MTKYGVSVRLNPIYYAKVVMHELIEDDVREAAQK
jgi:hypothetical protein